MKVAIKIICSIIFYSLASCSIRNSRGKVSESDTGLYFRDSLNQINMAFPGDYYFHAFKKKHFLNIPKSYQDYMSVPVDGKKPELLFAAHTFVPPIHSLVGVIYKTVTDTSQFIDRLKGVLSRQLNRNKLVENRVNLSSSSALRIDYQILNRDTRNYTIHREYVVVEQGRVIRFFAWTIESDPSIFGMEIENIIRKGFSR